MLRGKRSSSSSSVRGVWEPEAALLIDRFKFMSDILNKIITTKREEIAAAMALKPFSVLEAEAKLQSAPRDFVAAIREKLAAGLPA